MTKIFPPRLKEESFHCPHCGVLARQAWHTMFGGFGSQRFFPVSGGDLAECYHCKRWSVWIDGQMVFPDAAGGPMPNLDLEPEIRNDFQEARTILYHSPRGAAALLRLCIQKLCKQLGEPGKDINTDIGNLVKKGLSPMIQQALDVVRVVGNESVHPGEMDMRDDVETAEQLFELVNLIANERITQPKKVQELYAKLPAGKRQGIANRDGTTSQPTP